MGNPHMIHLHCNLTPKAQRKIKEGKKDGKNQRIKMSETRQCLLDIKGKWYVPNTNQHDCPNKTCIMATQNGQ